MTIYLEWKPFEHLAVSCIYKGHFPFDQNFRFEISKISHGKWNSKLGNFQVGLVQTVPFNFGQKFPEIYNREVLQTEIFSNRTVISNQNGLSEKSSPPRKVDLLVGQNCSIQFQASISGNFG